MAANDDGAHQKLVRIAFQSVGRILRVWIEYGTFPKDLDRIHQRLLKFCEDERDYFALGAGDAYARSQLDIDKYVLTMLALSNHAPGW